MLTRLGNAALQKLAQPSPLTNVYGLARTLLALGTALTLLFNHTGILFRPAAGVPTFPRCDGLGRASLFCLVPSGGLEAARWLALLGLLVVASGWRPRWTGILHWWIAFSFNAAAMTLDGGDQVTAVLTLLLLPITLADRRRWHWQSPAAATEPRPALSLLALSAFLVIRIQVAAIYFHAAIAKFAVEEWANGTVLYYWFTDPIFGAPDWLMPMLRPLLANGLTLTLMTWGALALETFLFMALVMDQRRWPPFLLLGLGLHGAIAVCHGLISFALAMMAALILYLRPVEQPFELGGLAAHASRLEAALRGRRAAQCPADPPAAAAG